MHKHPVTITLLVLYYLWFAYVGWHMLSGTDNEGEGLRLITMIIISWIIAAVYLCVFLFRVLVSKEPFKEHAVFLWLILVPAVIGLAYQVSVQ